MQEKWRCPFCERLHAWPRGSVEIFDRECPHCGRRLTKRRRGLRCSCGATAWIRAEVDPAGSLPELPVVPEMEDLRWRLLVTSAVYRRTNRRGETVAMLVDWRRKTVDLNEPAPPVT
jgi:hypothetical protein